MVNIFTDIVAMCIFCTSGTLKLSVFYPQFYTEVLQENNHVIYGFQKWNQKTCKAYH